MEPRGVHLLPAPRADPGLARRNPRDEGGRPASADDPAGAGLRPGRLRTPVVRQDAHFHHRPAGDPLAGRNVTGKTRHTPARTGLQASMRATPAARVVVIIGRAAARTSTG